VTIEATLRGLGTLALLEPAADLAKLTDVLASELATALPRVGRFGDGVLVAPISAAIGLDADAVYVVGLAEDTYPGRIHEDALLLERVRERADGELASHRDRLDARHRHLLAAFEAAPRVVASFPRGDLRRSTGRLPSRWLLPTLRELSGDRDLAATEWESATSDRIRGSESYARSLTTTAIPASEQEWRTRAAAVEGLARARVWWRRAEHEAIPPAVEMHRDPARPGLDRLCVGVFRQAFDRRLSRERLDQIGGRAPVGTPHCPVIAEDADLVPRKQRTEDEGGRRGAVGSGMLARESVGGRDPMVPVGDVER
jgi:hypothetical protein